MQPIGFATRRCGRSISSDLLALDLCAWGAKFLIDAFVAAIDLSDVIYRRLPLSGEGSDEQRHTGADVGRFEPSAVELAFADDDDAMRVAEDDLSAHGDERIDEEHSAFEHLFEEDDGALALRCRRDGDAHEIGGVCRPRRVVDLRNGVV